MKRVKEKKGLIRILNLICFLFMISLGLKQVALAAEDPVNEAKQGVVEIYSGFVADNGKFYRLQNTSGFVINNEDGGAYVVTNRHSLKNSNKAKKSYCKAHKIKMDGYTTNDEIRVVVKGDVTVPATVISESEKQDFSILQIEESINERKALKLGRTEGMVTGDTVYALGFAPDAGLQDDTTNRHTEFLALDVEIKEGHLQDTDANQNGILCLQHSAVISSGNSGGPLLNQEGYVVGINNALWSQEGASEGYALPIDEIREILDNFNIKYESIDKEASWEEFELLFRECTKLASDKSYKTKSKGALFHALEATGNIAESDFSDPERIEKGIQILNDAKGQLVPKMKTTRKVIIVLAVMIGYLFIRLICLLLWRHSNTELRKKKKKIGKKDGVISENIEEKTVILREEKNKKQKTEKKQIFANRKQRALLRCIRTGQTVLLDKPEVTIGKKEENDLAIVDNSAISRQHAGVSWENGNYYMTDFESANGTKINGIMIEPNEKVLLKDEDRILLADEKLIFKITNREDQ